MMSHREQTKSYKFLEKWQSLASLSFFNEYFKKSINARILSLNSTKSELLLLAIPGMSPSQGHSSMTLGWQACQTWCPEFVHEQAKRMPILTGINRIGADFGLNQILIDSPLCRHTFMWKWNELKSLHSWQPPPKNWIENQFLKE